MTRRELRRWQRRQERTWTTRKRNTRRPSRTYAARQ